MATEIVVHKIEIRRNGRRFGYLWVGKQGLQWKPVHRNKWGNITWEEFDQSMKTRADELGQRKWKLAE